MFENHPISYNLKKPFRSGTPLHEAVGLGKVDVAQAVLARGAGSAVRDIREESTIDKAERKDMSVLVDCLRNRGSIATPPTVYLILCKSNIVRLAAWISETGKRLSVVKSNICTAASRQLANAQSVSKATAYLNIAHI